MNNVDGNSKERSATKRKEWLSSKPTAHASDLHADLNTLKRDMGGMVRLGA